MNRRSFFRKVLYLALIAVLLVPLSLVSQPATVAVAGRPASPGGLLAQKRHDFKLGQANLGKIDPTGETIRLAALGMRGVATWILWSMADEYKMKEDWTGLSATLEQLAYLQPNYISVWHFQGWNLSYNVSAEWDDYHDRYYWVIKGIEYLQKGIAYNENEPRLLRDVGSFAAQKVGRSDEHLQFRRLFREDDAFHRGQWVHQRDNWLFAQAYFKEAQRVVENLGAPLTANPVVFYAESVMAQVGYATALEDDHRQALEAAALKSSSGSSEKGEPTLPSESVDKKFAAIIPAAWDEAERQWREYGNREFLGADRTPFRINDLESVTANLAATSRELDQLAPGMAQQLYDQKVARLPIDQRAALFTAPEKRSEEQTRLANLAQGKIMVAPHEIAERAPIPSLLAAKKLAARAELLDDVAAEIHGARETTNFDYWRMRCRMEKSFDAREARRLVLHGTVAYSVDGNLPQARADLEQAFQRWKAVLDTYPSLLTDPTAFEMVDAIRVYQHVLKQLDQPFPKPFVLQELLDQQDKLP